MSATSQRFWAQNTPQRRTHAASNSSSSAAHTHTKLIIRSANVWTLGWRSCACARLSKDSLHTIPTSRPYPYIDGYCNIHPGNDGHVTNFAAAVEVAHGASDSPNTLTPNWVTITPALPHSIKLRLVISSTLILPYYVTHCFCMLLSQHKRSPTRGANPVYGIISHREKLVLVDAKNQVEEETR